MARQHCLDHESDLASITSKGESDFAFKDLGIGEHDSWVGGRDEASEGVWTWSDGTPWEYESWHEEQPNNLGGMQTHVAFNFNSSAHWYDECKDEEKGFICYHKGM